MPENFNLNELMALFRSSLADTFQNPGMAPELLAQARSSASAGLRGRERVALERFRNRRAGTGLLRSGVTGRGEQDITDTFTGRLTDALHRIDMENARFTQQALARAQQGALGLGGLREQRRATNVARAVGMGNVRLGQDRLEFERQLQQLLVNLGIQSNQFGLPAGAPGGFSPGGISNVLGDFSPGGIPGGLGGF